MSNLQATTVQDSELTLTDSCLAVLEEYFSRSLGLTLIAMALLTILLTGSIPLTSSLADSTLRVRFPLVLMLC